MSKLKVSAFSISLDGYGAALDQSLQNPFGVGGMVLPAWFFPTRFFKKMIGQEGGETGIDNGFADRSFDNIGANILGRNMFGPVRGPWLDEDWKGWWGPNPPYHTPVFVLTHHARAPLEMEGGNVFHFVTGGIHEALERAKAAAKGKDIRLGGGVATVRQYLQAQLVDEMHLAMSPVLLGQGEALFAGLDLPKLGYRVSQPVAGEKATHFTVTRV